MRVGAENRQEIKVKAVAEDPFLIQMAFDDNLFYCYCYCLKKDPRVKKYRKVKAKAKAKLNKKK